MAREHAPETIRATSDSKRGGTRRQNARAVVPTAASPLSDVEATFSLEYATAAVARGARRPPAFVEAKEDGRLQIVPDPTKDAVLFWAQLSAAIGSPHREATGHLLSELNQVIGEKTNGTEAIGAALAKMLDIGPRDGVEGMLATQMVSVHSVAMRLLARGMHGDQSLEVATFRLNHATRLMRLFALQLETLNRHRGKAPSQQRVTVEHVHVHEGGQAVVGNVTSGPRPSHGPVTSESRGGGG
jgi:hypothetical protein